MPSSLRNSPMHVLIIGAGLIGVTTAYYLRCHGCNVTCVDRAEGVGLETSYANMGLLSPSLADPWNSPGVARSLFKWIGDENAPMLIRLRALPSLVGWGMTFLRCSTLERFENGFADNVRLVHYSLELMHELNRKHGFAYDHAARGTLKIVRDDNAFQTAKKKLHFLQKVGVAGRALSRDEVVDVEPALAPIARRLAGGIYCASDECGDAYRFCTALAQVASDMGVAFRLRTTVDRLHCEGLRIAAAVCGNEPITADAFVIAAASFSAPLLADIGIALPVRPVKGYTATMPRGNWASEPGMPVIDDSLHAAVVPIGSRIRVGGTAEFAGYDRTMAAARIENLLNLLREIYPEVETHLDPAAVKTWAGLRPMSADGVPIMGRAKFNNLFTNTGHGHLGWSMAAASGCLVADQIVDRSPEICMDSYSIERFR